MPVTILAFYHIQGGVGKTATTVNMAYLTAQSGAPTLLCDLDPQGAATYSFRVEPNVKAATKVFTQGGKHITRNIKATDYDHLDLLPADLSHRQTMQTLWDQDSRFLRHVIPYLADIEKMGLHHAPVAAFAPRSGAAQAYQRVWEECQRRFDAAARTTRKV